MKKIKCIIHCGDIHIRNFRRHDEYREQLGKFIEDCKEISSKYKKEEVRIIIAGDIFHQKIQISNELLILVSWFFKELDNIATVIVLAGNHDLLENNRDRMDSITPIFEIVDFEEAIFIDSITKYKSACVEDEDIVWVVYSIFDNYTKPDIETSKLNHPNKTFIGLFHGPIVGSSTDVGHIMEKGISGDIFDGCDFVICGDIHKRQELNINGVDIFYPSSLIQQNYGENVSCHGYFIHDLENNTHESVDIPNDYGFYSFKINSFQEVEDGVEKLLNL